MPLNSVGERAVIVALILLRIIWSVLLKSSLAFEEASEAATTSTTTTTTTSASVTWSAASNMVQSFEGWPALRFDRFWIWTSTGSCFWGKWSRSRPCSTRSRWCLGPEVLEKAKNCVLGLGRIKQALTLVSTNLHYTSSYLQKTVHTYFH